MSGVRRACVAVGVAAVAALPLAGCATLVGARPLDAARVGATSYHLLRVDGRARSVLLHLPPAAARGPVPLVLVLHGHHADGAVARDATGFDAAADARGVAVAYAEGTGPLRRAALAWNTGGGFGWAEAHGVDDVRFVDALLDTLVGRGWVQPRRVVAAGFSAGGMLALRLACERAERFAAVVDVAGTMPDRACRPTRPLRVLLVQGDADPELRAEHAAARALHRLRGHGHAFATSLEGAFEFWARQARCAPTRTLAVHRGWRLVRADRCAPGGDAALVTVEGHPHAWPGGVRSWVFAPRPSDAVDATQLTLDLVAPPDPVVGAGDAGRRASAPR